jgi:hypothetical protein
MIAVPGGKYVLASDVVGVDVEREIAELREAVRVLAEIAACAADDSPDHDRDFLAWQVGKINNPIAAAAVKEAGQ